MKIFKCTTRCRNCGKTNVRIEEREVSGPELNMNPGVPIVASCHCVAHLRGQNQGGRTVQDVVIWPYEVQ